VLGTLAPNAATVSDAGFSRVIVVAVRSIDSCQIAVFSSATSTTTPVPVFSRA